MPPMMGSLSCLRSSLPWADPPHPRCLEPATLNLLTRSNAGPGDRVPGARDLPNRPTDPAHRPTLLGMTAPAPGPQSASLSTAVESLALQVNQETVLQARAVLLGEAQRLKDEMKRYGVGISVGLCGGDPVSADATKAFGERIEVLINHCNQHVSDLERAGEQLADTARRYGFTEAEVTGSFGA